MTPTVSKYNSIKRSTDEPKIQILKRLSPVISSDIKLCSPTLLYDTLMKTKRFPSPSSENEEASSCVSLSLSTRSGPILSIFQRVILQTD